jgi:excisionase family DNA binding protein
MVPKLLLTVPEAAKAMSLSRSKLYELIAARKVRSVKVDGARRIPTDALTEYINALLNEEAA